MVSIPERIQNSFRAQALMTTLGATLAFVDDGEVHIALPFDPRLSQQHGYTHAGAITSVLDSACGYAALTRAPAQHEVVTAEFKINFVRPAIGAHFLAVGRVRHAGRLLTVCDGEVRAFTDDGAPPKVIALMQATIVNVAT
jgi:uncharacterized protein (TIGR00369 family)